MTIDYLNIACIRCWGCCAHLPCICLRGQEVDCPPLYWYCLSYMMTGTIFSEKKEAKLLVFLNFLLLTAFLMFLYLYRYHVYLLQECVGMPVFSWSYMNTQTALSDYTVLCCTVIVRQEPMKHICWKMLVYFNILSAYTLQCNHYILSIWVSMSHIYKHLFYNGGLTCKILQLCKIGSKAEGGHHLNVQVTHSLLACYFQCSVCSKVVPVTGLWLSKTIMAIHTHLWRVALVL